MNGRNINLGKNVVDVQTVILDEVGPELDAIVEQRSLLADADHVSPLAAKLATALREALTVNHERLSKGVKEAEAQLVSDATWKKLDPGTQAEILASIGLVRPTALAIASDDELLHTLDESSLATLRHEIDSVPARTATAIEDAAKRLKKEDPKIKTTTISIRRGTLSDKAAVSAWLEETKSKLVEAVKKGPVIIR